MPSVEKLEKESLCWAIAGAGQAYPTADFGQDPPQSTKPGEEQSRGGAGGRQPQAIAPAYSSGQRCVKLVDNNGKHAPSYPAHKHGFPFRGYQTSRRAR